MIASYDVRESLLDKAKRMDDIVNNIPTFKLEKVPSTFLNHKKRMFVVDNYGNLVSLVSDKYVLVQPKEILLKILAIIEKDIEILEIYYYGGIIFVKCRTGRVIPFGDKGLKVGFIYSDSVTGWKRLRMVFAPTILECGNDIVLHQHSFSGKHIAEIYRDVGRYIAEFQEWMMNIEVLKKVKEKAEITILKQEQAKAIINNLNIPMYVRNEIQITQSITIWELYMKLTNVITRLRCSLRIHLEASKLIKMVEI